MADKSGVSTLIGSSSISAADCSTADLDDIDNRYNKAMPFRGELDELSLEMLKLECALGLLQRRRDEFSADQQVSLSKLIRTSASFSSKEVSPAETKETCTPFSLDLQIESPTNTSIDTCTPPPLSTPLITAHKVQPDSIEAPGDSICFTTTPLQDCLTDTSSPSFSSLSAATTSSSASLHHKTSTIASSLNEYDVQFRVVNINEATPARANIIDALVKEFPHLCEGPARMFTPDGRPLPPTRNQETSDAERQARKNALIVIHRGITTHSLLQVSLLLQSRSIIWRRVGGGDLTAQKSGGISASKLDPWRIDMLHSGMDINEMPESNQSSKTFEISNSRTIDKCDRCQGSKEEDCRHCRGFALDTCWWCKGEGKSSKKQCHQCLGKGSMECRPCQGSKKTSCGLCQSQGTGLYAAFLRVSMTRVEFDSIPLSSFIKTETYIMDPIQIQSACVEKAKETVSTFLTSTKFHEEEMTGKKKKNTSTPRQHRVHQVSASLNNSTSQLFEVSVPQHGKLVPSKKKAASTLPTLKSKNLFQRKLSSRPFYCVLPSDPTLCLVQLSDKEYENYLDKSRQLKEVS